MNMGSSLFLLALLTILGGTPTDGLCKVPPALLRKFEVGKSLGNQKEPIEDNSSCNDVGEPLILTPYIELPDIREAKKLARLHPEELTQINRGYTAFLTVNKEYESNLFFWYAVTKNKKKTSTAPLVLWLNGGPGGSSLVGLFNENGPYTVNVKDGEPIVLPSDVTWTEDYNMLYVDQPAGTGFSFTKDERGYATNEDMVAADMYEFILQFFLLFPYRMENDFYLAGQSYAGKYVPAIANKINEMNKREKLKKNRLPLTGLAIGNGLTDPIHQYFWSDFLFQVGLVDKKGKDEVAAEAEKARTYIQEEKWTAAADAADNVVSTYTAKTGVSFYNFLKQPNDYSWVGNYPYYLNQPSIREAIHVGKQPYSVYNYMVCSYMIDDVAKSMASEMQTLLDDGYKVLIYHGQIDAIITYHGTEQYIRSLTWEGASEYKKAKRVIWKVDGEVAGYAREVLKLRQVMVRNAGHSAPTDQPEWAFDMMKRFTNEQTFGLQEPVPVEQPMNGRLQA